MTNLMAAEIKRRLEKTGFKVGEIHNGELSQSADGIVAEFIVKDKSNNTRFNIAVYQSADDDMEDTENPEKEAELCGPPQPRLSPYERRRADVYATGNRWAIENFNATH